MRALGLGVPMAALLVASVGCARREMPRAGEDTERTGVFLIVASCGLHDPVGEYATGFCSSQPQATLELTDAVPPNHDVAELVAQRADVALVGRELTQEELKPARRKRIEVERLRLGQDGFVGWLSRRVLWNTSQRFWCDGSGPASFATGASLVVPELRVLPALHANLARAFVTRVVVG